MKESYYFQHDYDALNDPKIQALICQFKAEGYGIYWAIIELLHKEVTHKLPLKSYIFSALAKQMATSVEQVENLLKYAIEECDLFTEKDGFFYSNRVLRNFEKREEIIEKRRLAGQKSAFMRNKATYVEQNLTSVEQNLTKEKKKNKNIYIEGENSDEVQLVKPNRKITKRDPEPHKLNDHIKENYPDSVAMMPIQMTAEQCDKLLKEYGVPYVKDILSAMSTWWQLDKRKDVYKTFKTFARNKEQGFKKK